jgi:hypothetical protein
MPASLNSEAIDRAIKGFPSKAGWKMQRCNELEHTLWRSLRRLDWPETESDLNDEAGLYAFLFPVSAFPHSIKFRLHGPSKKNKARRIPFNVTPSHQLKPFPGHFVAYVGRTIKLRSRLKQHFHATKTTTSAQVRESLRRSMEFSRNVAIDFMIRKATIAYLAMPGDANVANRDIIEVALWAKYRTPFNIKSER